jgi:hypothetical protein
MSELYENGKIYGKAYIWNSQKVTESDGEEQKKVRK